MEISIEQATDAASNSFGRLAEEHRQYSRKLDVLLAQPYLTDSDQLEAARLKKLKLKMKDEMERSARPAQPSVA